jgi:hypothetical protein
MGSPIEALGSSGMFVVQGDGTALYVAFTDSPNVRQQFQSGIGQDCAAITALATYIVSQVGGGGTANVLTAVADCVRITNISTVCKIRARFSPTNETFGTDDGVIVPPETERVINQKAYAIQITNAHTTLATATGDVNVYCQYRATS